MELRVHIKPEWYDKLVDSARRGSKAEICLKSATYRQLANESEGEYELRCDDQTISVIAALADVACPEAIPALLQAYRKAMTG
jgi:hypothetical protein